IFLPDGSVQTADGQGNPKPLPFFNGNYHIVVASGVEDSNSETLTHCGECFTICISPIGGVEMQGGLVGDPGGVAITGTIGLPSAMPTSPQTEAIVDGPIFGSNADADPTKHLGLKLKPDPVQPLPPGVNATIKPGEYTTLTMSALSTTGDALECQFSVTTQVA